MFLCMLAIKKNPLNYLLPVKQKALYPHLPCFASVLPCGVSHNSFPENTAFPLLSLAHLCSYEDNQALSAGI